MGGHAPHRGGAKGEDAAAAQKSEYGADQKINPLARDLVIGMVGACLLVWFCCWLGNYIRAKYRKKCDISGHVAVALARIHNRDCTRKQRKRVKIGVGSDPDNIEEWLEDILYTYDLDKENCMDRDAFRKFIDHTLKVGQVRFTYYPDDLDELMREIDRT